MRQQEASVASITCSLIIVRSEDAFNHPTTNIGTVSTMVTTPPIGNTKYPRNKDGEVFHLNSSMGTDVTEKPDSELPDGRV